MTVKNAKLFLILLIFVFNYFIMASPFGYKYSTFGETGMMFSHL